MYYNAKTLSEFYEQVTNDTQLLQELSWAKLWSALYTKNSIVMNFTQLGNQEKATEYQNIANEYRLTVQDVFWDSEEGFWFDYDLINKSPRKLFYASNIVPLWAGTHSDNADISKVIAYMKKMGVLKERGGVPTSPIQSGEQWDYPNGWAPLQHLIVDGLAKTDHQEAHEVAYELADKWIRTNYKAFLQSTPNHMFEKVLQWFLYLTRIFQFATFSKLNLFVFQYDVTVEGLPGGGGEYDVVVGFGWTNGVVLDFLYRYGDRMKAQVAALSTAEIPKPNSVFTPATIVIGGLTVAIASLFG